MQEIRLGRIINITNIKKCEDLSLQERRKLLLEILCDVKKYKNLKIDDPRKKKLLSEDMDLLFRNIYNNNELVKSDSDIILSNRKIVQNNLEKDDNLRNIYRQKRLLELMYGMIVRFQIPMFRSKSTIMPYDDNIVNSLLIDLCGINIYENAEIITQESINDNIIDKHNEILRLSKEIRHRNL